MFFFLGRGVDFVMCPKWQSSIGRFSQIWQLQAKYESKISKHPSVFLATLHEIHWFFLKFGAVLAIESKRALDFSTF
jgi:hypothetical protein